MNFEKWPARMSLNEKLERLQISEKIFELYCSTFIQDWACYLKKKPNSDWSLFKQKGIPVRLTRDTVAYHLLLRYLIATFSPHVTRLLAFDLDPSNERQSIYLKIKEWVKEPLVIQSSGRQGIHLYAHLDFAVKTDKLYEITKMELNAKGVKVAPGICELFPCPNKYLRLPLGAQSRLLDSETLAPICPNLNEALDFISTNIRYRKFEDLFPGLLRKVNERE